MERKYMAHPAKLAVSLPTSVLLLWGGVIQLPTRFWWCGILLILFGVLFLLVAGLYGRIVHLDSSGVRWTLLGKVMCAHSWEQIGEIGVVGTNVLNGGEESTAKAPGPPEESGDKKRSAPSKPPRIGTPYIYFSERALTEEQRFALALKWPPKGMIFLRFSPERVAQVQSISQKYVEHYNTGNLTF